MIASIFPQTPILVGVASCQQRMDQPAAAREPYELMGDAVKAAADDTGCPDLLSQVERISVPQGMWGYKNPAQLIAEMIGSSSAQTVFSEIGVLQQTLIADSCDQISRGEIDIAVVAGGEAKYRQLMAKINGVECPERIQSGALADVVIKPATEIWLESESAAGLGMPVGFYAIYASAIRAHCGLTMSEDALQLAAMYQRFSEIAAGNTQAWKRERVCIEEFLTVDEKNPMLAFPYTKLHNSFWNVDQAAGLIFTSVAKAKELGIPREKWVFPLALAESNHMVSLSQRKELYRLPGARLCAEHVLSAHNCLPSDIAFWNLYSCFPVAVQLYAKEAKIPQGRDYTVTGGMPFAGGPLNNYVLQSVVKMAQLLRDNKTCRGMISSVSGILTKQAFGLWSGEPGEYPYSSVDISEQVEKETPIMQVKGSYRGGGHIAGYTVLFQSGVAYRAVAAIDIDECSRCIAYCEDPESIQRMMEEEFVGRRVWIDGGQFSVRSTV